MRKIFGILVILTAIFFYPIFWGHVFYFGDNLSLFLPNKIFWAQEIKTGHFPLWNPYLFSGVPFLADIGLGTFYPLHFLFLFLSAPLALTILIVLEIFLAGLFMAIYLRILKLSEWQAILGAVIFMFSASLLTFVNNVTILNTTIWLPLVFALLELTFHRKSFLWPVLAGVVLGIQILAGHPQPTFYTIFLGILYIFFKIRIGLGEKIKQLFIIFFLAMALSAIQTIPSLEASFYSTRTRFDFTFISSWSLSFPLLFRFVFPWIFGLASWGISWGPAFRLVADNTGYIGITSLVILILALFSKDLIRKRETRFFLFLSFLALTLALGRNTPVFHFFFKYFFGFNLFRSPTQILLIFNFSLAVLVALAAGQIGKIAQRYSGWKFFCFLSLTLCLIAAIAFIGQGKIYPPFLRLAERVYWLVKKQPLATSPFHTYARDQVIFRLLTIQFSLSFFVLSLLFSLFYLKKAKQISEAVFYSALIILVFFDLAVFNRNNLFLGKTSIFEDSKQKEILEFFKKEKEPFRVVSSAGFWPYTGLNVYWENVALRGPFAPSVFDQKEAQNFNILRQRMAVIPPDWNMRDRLFSPMGYGALVISHYADFLSQETGRINVNEVDSVKLDDERLNFLNVRYLLVDASFPSTVAEVEKFPWYQLVYEKDNVRIYENKKVFPRAFFADEEGKVLEDTVEFRGFNTDEITLEVSLRKESTLVLSEVYYPGWEAFIDGEKVSVEKYAGAFRAIKVPTGNHVVKFLFRPKSVFLGGAISLVFLVAVIAWGAWLWIIKIK